jgi:DMSO/TMAO reductase YedYZ molybdopterin-dependent catalytic subunit
MAAGSGDLANDWTITPEELQLAARNHGMPLEALRYDVTPLGMHYLLTHFDVPEADAATWTVQIDGLVRSPRALTFGELQARETVTLPVTMECAGNGRARLSPRPISQPWLQEAVGTAEWIGTPLGPILEEVGVLEDAVELIFTGADHGTQGGEEHDYARSLTLDEAMREDVLLVWAVNGQPLPPQHGFPIRLIVPGWYGMTSVKWLRRITATAEPFDGFQMRAYRLRLEEDEEGVPVTRMLPRALMIPPGFPDFLTRERYLAAGLCELRGRAWSGWGRITRVEVSTDGGDSWSTATLGPPPPATAWVAWTFAWDATPGRHVVLARATDAAGNVQPLEQSWNHHGFANNQVQSVTVTVS